MSALISYIFPRKKFFGPCWHVLGTYPILLGVSLGWLSDVKWVKTSCQQFKKCDCVHECVSSIRLCWYQNMKSGKDMCQNQNFSYQLLIIVWLPKVMNGKQGQPSSETILYPYWVKNTSKYASTFNSPLSTTNCVVARNGIQDNQWWTFNGLIISSAHNE